MNTSKKHFRKRDAILECLRNTDQHPSAEMVFSQLKQEYADLSLGTVYRNLSMFKNQGVIASLGTVNGVERFDGNIEPHVHFVCSCCGAVLDLPHMQVPEELSQTVQSQTGGQVEFCSLSFTGTCRECLQKLSQEETA